jgi:hypothetical protein
MAFFAFLIIGLIICLVIRKAAAKNKTVVRYGATNEELIRYSGYKKISELNIPALIGMSAGQISERLAPVNIDYAFGPNLHQHTYFFVIGDIPAGLEVRFLSDTLQVNFICFYNIKKGFPYEQLLKLGGLNDKSEDYILEKQLLGAKKDIFAGIYIYEPKRYPELKAAGELR